MASWSREGGAAVLVKTDRPHRTLAKSFGVARVSAEEQLANYRAARALLGKGNAERVRERGSSAKKGARDRGEEGETEEVSVRLSSSSSRLSSSSSIS